MHTSQPQLPRRWAATRTVYRCLLSLVAALSTCLLLAGCTQHSVPTTPATTPRLQGLAMGFPKTGFQGRPALCRSAAAPTRLRVVRRDAFPQNHVMFTFPARRLINDPARVADVANALCSLPAMPNGVVHCPMDWGITYQLRFTGPHARFAPVTVSATGCLTVRGLGSPRWIMRSPRFWPTLARLMDVRGPAYATLRGTPRRGAP